MVSIDPHGNDGNGDSIEQTNQRKFTDQLNAINAALSGLSVSADQRNASTGGGKKDGAQQQASSSHGNSNKICPRLQSQGVCKKPDCPFEHMLPGNKLLCKDCNVLCTSASNFDEHMAGLKHAKTVKRLETAGTPLSNNVSAKQQSGNKSKPPTGPKPAVGKKPAAVPKPAADPKPPAGQKSAAVPKPPPGPKPLVKPTSSAGWKQRNRHKQAARVQRAIDKQAIDEAKAAEFGISLPPDDAFHVPIVDADGPSCRLAISINNTGNDAAVILPPRFVNHQTNTLQMAHDGQPKKRAFDAHSTTTVSFIYTPKKIGYARVRIYFEFKCHGKKLMFSRLFKAHVGDIKIIEMIAPTEPYRPPPRASNILDHAFGKSHTKDIIPAPAIRKALNSIPCSNLVRQLKKHDVPEDIKKMIVYPESAKLSGVLDMVAANILPLDMTTREAYLEHYRSLLWIEEIQMDVNIKSYSLVGVTMRKMNGNRYALTVDGLAENRPSVMRGDSVYVKLSDSNDTRVYEGKADMIEMLNVVLVFDRKFTDRFISGGRYDVEFTYSRTILRRMHEALHRESLFTSLDAEFARLDMELRAREAEAELKAMEEMAMRPFDAKVHTNPEQRRAVSIILRGVHAPFPFLLFGPPGTGKTVTLIESIKQIYFNMRESRLLICAPSNSAADLLLERLSSVISKLGMFRLNATFRPRESSFKRMEGYSLYDEQVRQYVVPELSTLKKYRVIVSTCCSAAMLHAVGMPKGHFTHVFVDEAGQGLEPELLIPLNMVEHSAATRFVLAGDHKQLGPILHSKISKHFGLGVSLLERFMGYVNPYDIAYPVRVKDLHHPRHSVDPKDTARREMVRKAMSTVSVKLLKNYRSHHDILTVPNKLFYDNELQTCGDKLMTHQYLGWDMLPNATSPILFQHVDGKDEREGASPSWFNMAEIQVVVKLVTNLIGSRVSGASLLTGADIGVIAPYNRQVQKLRKVLLPRMPGVSIGSVDSFQGQERKVMIVSTVRSNPDHLKHDVRFNLGFVSDPKRFNVAMTRAKALCIVVGNAHILSGDDCWRAWIRYAIERKAARHLPVEVETAMRGEMGRIDSLVSAVNALKIGDGATGDGNDLPKDEYYSEDDDESEEEDAVLQNYDATWRTEK